MTEYEKLIRCFDSVRAKTDFVPKFAVVLGSGLGGFGDNVEVDSTVEYKDIEGFPLSTAPGHMGRFVFGRIAEVPVVIMQGRVHMYEGYSAQEVVLPVRLMGLLGAKVLFLTNAAGCANPDFCPGDLMLITDQISCFVPSPLIGENLSALGVRFPDMSRIYDKKLCQALRRTASENCIMLREGIYLQLRGPQFETPAEVRACRILGADALGMSTAVEAIAARHMGLRVCGISCITNLAAGMNETPLTQEEVMETGQRVAEQFATLVSRFIASIGNIL
ncbi:MAG: purine-nucleoside phosphorylase [Clostridia bacterium]|nr:purine-nucleoside phosphorylase [Clostridia bacterium]